MSDSSTPPDAGPRLVLLSATHRVAPGLLSWPAWEVLRAGRVFTADPGHPQLPYLREAGVDVTVAAEGTPHELAKLLVTEAHAGVAVWLPGADGDPGLGEALAAEAARGEGGPVIELVPASWDLPGARLLDLVEVMDRLRSPGGCPWDARQTHESLVRYLVEEAYELVDAIDSGERDHLREELGDVLMQVVFHARVAAEDPDDPFTIDDVAAGIVEKLTRRHPHVFADVVADTAEHVERNWDRIKAEEKGRASAVDGVALAQPALSLAAKLASRARRAGIDVEPPPAPAADAGPMDADALGDLLLGVADLASRLDLDPETALRAAALRHRDRIREAEQA